jgi:hypothetical protein
MEVGRDVSSVPPCGPCVRAHLAAVRSRYNSCSFPASHHPVSTRPLHRTASCRPTHCFSLFLDAWLAAGGRARMVNGGALRARRDHGDARRTCSSCRISCSDGSFTMQRSLSRCECHGGADRSSDRSMARNRPPPQTMRCMHSHSDGRRWGHEIWNGRHQE